MPSENDSGKPAPEHSTPWWAVLFRVLLGLNASDWKHLFLRTITIGVALLIVIAAAVYLGTHFLGLRITGGQLYLGGERSSEGVHVTVDAVDGLQNSHVFMKKGDHIILEPEGRIHLAADQAYNFARAAKPLIIHYLPKRTWPDALKRRYPMPKLDETIVFYRGWVGPEGESFESDLLADCKLRREVNWGTILVTVIQTEVSASADPLEILSANSMTTSELIPVPGKTDFVANRDGWLTFIVNDAVISPYSQSKDSRDFYDALRSGAEYLSNGSRYRIPLQTLPLVFYSDNLGAFRITLTRPQ